MLCYHDINNGHGDICTNRCPERPSCTKPRIPLLIEALDILASDLETGEINGTPYTSFKTYCVAPEAYINGLILSMLENEYPTMAFVPCYVCGKAVTMPESQKEDFSVNNFTKYNKLTIAYCSKDCQEKHLTKLSEAKNVASGSLKNHSTALVIHGADVSKRPKEKEVHIITGRDSRQRAACVVYKLQSMSERIIKIKSEKTATRIKYLSPKEIQEFLLVGISSELKVKPERIQVTASEIMTLTTRLYPEAVCIGWVNDKDRVLMSIK